MIRSFRHKGLRILYENSSGKGISADMLPKIERILARLDVADRPQTMNLPGFRLHPLKGDLQGFWAVSVTGNWRMTFRFAGGDPHDVDLVDYH